MYLCDDITKVPKLIFGTLIFYNYGLSLVFALCLSMFLLVYFEFRNINLTVPIQVLILTAIGVQYNIPFLILGMLCLINNLTIIGGADES